MAVTEATLDRYRGIDRNTLENHEAWIEGNLEGDGTEVYPRISSMCLNSLGNLVLILTDDTHPGQSTTVTVSYEQTLLTQRLILLQDEDGKQKRTTISVPTDINPAITNLDRYPQREEQQLTQPGPTTYKLPHVVNALGRALTVIATVTNDASKPPLRDFEREVAIAHGVSPELVPPKGYVVTNLNLLEVGRITSRTEDYLMRHGELRGSQVHIGSIQEYNRRHASLPAA